jgi:hypothetical protein
MVSFHVNPSEKLTLLQPRQSPISSYESRIMGKEKGMTTELVAIVSSWLTRLLQRPDDGLPTWSNDDIAAAIDVAEQVKYFVTFFRDRNAREFPQKLGTLALADKFDQTLRGRHGGVTQYRLLKLFRRGKTGNLSSLEDRKAAAKLCGKWAKGSGKH